MKLTTNHEVFFDGEWRRVLRIKERDNLVLLRNDVRLPFVLPIDYTLRYLSTRYSSKTFGPNLSECAHKHLEKRRKTWESIAEQWHGEAQRRGIEIAELKAELKQDESHKLRTRLKNVEFVRDAWYDRFTDLSRYVGELQRSIESLNNIANPRF